MKKFMLLFALLVSTSVYAKVIATVNGYPIYEKEANTFLKVATKGKATYKVLTKKDKKALVDRLAVDKLVLKTALKEISQVEQDRVIAGYWLQKKVAKVKIGSKEIKKAYKENKKFFKDKKGKTLPYAKVKDIIKTSLLQKKVVAKLMKKAKVVMGTKGLKSRKKSSKKSSKSTKKSSSKNIYVVESGNTLSGIANKYGITTKELRKMNDMSDSEVIKIGQKLKVPSK